MGAGMRPAEVAAVAGEIAARVPWRVRAAHQDGRLRFRLALADPSGRADLVVDLDPAFPRVHLAPASPAPTAPSPFAGALRKALRGAQLVAAEAVGGERALALRFRRGEEGSTLWFEGFGRGANLYLVDGAGVVRLTPRGDIAGRRAAGVGSPFTPVPPRAEGEPGAGGTGGPPGDGPDAGETAADDPTAPGPTASEGVALAAAEAAAGERAARRRVERLRRLRAEVERAGRRVEDLERMGAEAADADALQRRAELLQASFHLLRPGLAEVRVPDLLPGGDGTEVEVALDPRRPPGEQVAALFRGARRARRAAAESAERLPAAREALAAARQALAEAEAAPADAEDPGCAAAVAASGGGGEARARGGEDPGEGPGRGAGRPRTGEAAAWRVFLSADGWRILVGRDARGNDRLTFGEARAGDLFLHVRSASGSHVIVPTPRGQTVPKETLLDAAELAAWYSDRRGAGRVEVDHLPRGRVRKPRGAPPGLVTVERPKTLRICPSEARRARLLATRPG